MSRIPRSAVISALMLAVAAMPPGMSGGLGGGSHTPVPRPVDDLPPMPDLSAARITKAEERRARRAEKRRAAMKPGGAR